MKNSLYNLFCDAVAQYSTTNLFGSYDYYEHKYKYLSYIDVYNDVKKIIDGQSKLASNNIIGIYSYTRFEVIECILANLFLNNTIVLINSAIGEKDLIHTINDSKIKLIYITSNKLNKIRKNKFPYLQYIVVYDVDPRFYNINDIDVQFPIIKFSILKNNKVTNYIDNEVNSNSICPFELSFVLYKCDNNGKLKKLSITESKILHNVSILKFDSNNKYMSYLTYTNIQELSILFCLIKNCIQISFYRGNIKKLIRDIKDIKPTIFHGPSLIFRGLCRYILKQINNNIFYKRYTYYLSFLIYNNIGRYDYGITYLLNKLILYNVNEYIYLNNCKHIIISENDLDENTLNFIKAIFHNSNIYSIISSNCDMLIIYLQTFGIKSNMNYCPCNKNIGTLFIKESSLSNNLYCSDIIVKLINNNIKYIDNVDNIYMINDNDYISIRRIENIITRNKYIKQVCVIYDGELTAIIVPNINTIFSLFIDKETMKDYDENIDLSNIYNYTIIKKHFKEIKAIIEKTLRDQYKLLKKYEIPKNIIIVKMLNENLNGFAINNYLLTPSLSLRREYIYKKFIKKAYI